MCYETFANTTPRVHSKNRNEKKVKKIGIMLNPCQHNTRRTAVTRGRKKDGKLVWYQTLTNATPKVHSKNRKKEEKEKKKWYVMKPLPILRENYTQNQEKEENKVKKTGIICKLRQHKIKIVHSKTGKRKQEENGYDIIFLAATPADSNTRQMGGPSRPQPGVTFPSGCGCWGQKEQERVQKRLPRLRPSMSYTQWMLNFAIWRVLEST